MKKIFLFLVCGFLLNACVTTAPMKLGKPVEVKGEGFFSRHYEQEGRVLDLPDAFDKLSLNSATKDKAQKTKYMYYGSLSLAAVGGFLIGYNLVSTSGNRSQNMMTGVLVAGGGFALGYYTSLQLNEMIDIYNQSLGYRKKKSSMNWRLTPYAINDRAGVGFNLSF